MVRWADNYRTGQLGGPRLLEALTAGAVPDERVPGAQYGGGLHITPDGAIGHGGHWAGNISFLTISPDRRTAVAGSCNAEDGIDFEKVLPGIQGIWFG